MSDLFKDILPAILQTKQPVITEENERDYVPYIVNRALSFHRDCVMFSNEMNQYPNTDKLLQFHHLLNRVRGYRRPFQPWQKRVDPSDLEVVKEYYGFSNEKAKSALTILSNDQIDEIRKRLDKGGLKNAKPGRTNRGRTSKIR